MMKLFLVVILMDALAGATTKIKRVPREEYKLDFGPDTRDTTECFEVDLKVYKIAELILGDNMKKPSTQIVQQVFLEYDELRPVAEGEANDKYDWVDLLEWIRKKPNRLKHAAEQKEKKAAQQKDAELKRQKLERQQAIQDKLEELGEFGQSVIA